MSSPLDALFANFQPSISNEDIASLQGTLSGLETAPLQTGQLEDVPGGVNPFAEFGSTFAATLAEQLGARGAAGRNENRLQQANAQGPMAEARNNLKVQAAQIGRQKERLALLDQIGEMKLAQAKEIGNVKEMEMQTRAAMQRDKQNAQYDRELEEMKIGGRLTQAREEADLKADAPQKNPLDTPGNRKFFDSLNKADFLPLKEKIDRNRRANKRGTKKDKDLPVSRIEINQEITAYRNLIKDRARVILGLDLSKEELDVMLPLEVQEEASATKPSLSAFGGN